MHGATIKNKVQVKELYE